MADVWIFFRSDACHNNVVPLMGIHCSLDYGLTQFSISRAFLFALCFRKYTTGENEMWPRLKTLEMTERIINEYSETTQ